jgi:large subunit ribosomal protein L13
VDAISYKTVSLNKATVKKEWLVIDATDLVVGRLCSTIAVILRGKHKAGFTPHVDCGDNVILLNSEKIQFTGDKWANKRYVRHTGYPGGQRLISPEKQMAKDPRKIIEHAVKGMLPRNRLSRRLIHNLFVYAGTEHPHEAQKPRVININTIK